MSSLLYDSDSDDTEKLSDKIVNKTSAVVTGAVTGLQATAQTFDTGLQMCQNMLNEKDEENKALKIENKKYKEFYTQMENFLNQQTTCQKCNEKFDDTHFPYILSCNHVICGICLNIKEKEPSHVDVEGLNDELTMIKHAIQEKRQEVQQNKEIVLRLTEEKDEALKKCPSAAGMIRFLKSAFNDENVEDEDEGMMYCKIVDNYIKDIKKAEDVYNDSVDDLNRLTTKLSAKKINIKQINVDDWYTKKCPLCKTNVKALILDKFILQYTKFQSNVNKKYVEIMTKKESIFDFGKNRTISRKSVRKSRKSVKKSRKSASKSRKSARKSRK